MKKKPNRKSNQKWDWPKIENDEAKRDKKLFLDIHSPSIPIHLFVRAYKNNQPLPKWVFRWLADAFEKYLDSGFKVKMEKLLGVGARGKRSELKQSHILNRDIKLFAEILTLQACGVTLETAIQAVADRRESVRPFGSVKASYLRKRYYEKNYKIRRHPFVSFSYWSASKWSPNRKKNFIQRFPLLNSGFKVT